MSTDHRVGRISADGLVTVAVAGDVDAPPPACEECLVLKRGGWFRRRFECGHSDKPKYKLRVYGANSKWIKQKKRCAECELQHWLKIVKRCCYCRNPIFPGDPIALYALDSPGIAVGILPIEVPAEGEGTARVYLGCLRWGCASGGDFCGHWTENGFKQYDFSAS